MHQFHENLNGKFGVMEGSETCGTGKGSSDIVCVIYSILLFSGVAV